MKSKQPSKSPFTANPKLRPNVAETPNQDILSPLGKWSVAESPRSNISPSKHQTFGQPYQTNPNIFGHARETGGLSTPEHGGFKPPEEGESDEEEEADHFDDTELPHSRSLSQSQRDETNKLIDEATHELIDEIKAKGQEGADGDHNMEDAEWEELRRSFQGKRLNYYLRHYNDVKDILFNWCQRYTSNEKLQAFNDDFVRSEIERAREQTQEVGGVAAWAPPPDTKTRAQRTIEAAHDKSKRSRSDESSKAGEAGARTVRLLAEDARRPHSILSASARTGKSADASVDLLQGKPCCGHGKAKEPERLHYFSAHKQGAEALEYIGGRFKEHIDKMRQVIQAEGIEPVYRERKPETRSPTVPSAKEGHDSQCSHASGGPAQLGLISSSGSGEASEGGAEATPGEQSPTNGKPGKSQGFWRSCNCACPAGCKVAQQADTHKGASRSPNGTPMSPKSGAESAQDPDFPQEGTPYCAGHMPTAYEALTKQQAVVQGYHEENDKQIHAEMGKLKVPIEYATQFLADRGMGSGALCAAPPAKGVDPEVAAARLAARNRLNDAIRVSYLVKRLEKLQDFYEQEMKELHTRNQAKIRRYAVKCFSEIRVSMEDSFRLIFWQLELLKTKEFDLGEYILELEKVIITERTQIMELAEYAQWDEHEHARYTEDLVAAGLTKELIANAATEQTQMKRIYGRRDYYRGLLAPSLAEKDCLDFQRPFALYTGSIQIGLTERINLLERETVKIYQKRLNQQQGIVDSYEAKEAPESKEANVMEIMENEFNVLKDDIAGLEGTIAQLKEDWEKDRIERDQAMADLREDYEFRLREQHDMTEHLKMMYLKELGVKDMIIEKESGMKETYRKVAADYKMQLSIPRHHMEFLKQKGALDHFVSYKLTGDDISAKWLLLQAGKTEITAIQKANQGDEVETAKKERRYQKLKMYGLLDKAAASEQRKNESTDGLAQNSTMALREQSSLIMTGTSIEGVMREKSQLDQPSTLQGASLTRPVFDLNIQQVLNQDLNKIPMNPQSHRRTGGEGLDADTSKHRQLTNRQASTNSMLMGTVQSSHRETSTSKKPPHPLVRISPRAAQQSATERRVESSEKPEKQGWRPRATVSSRNLADDEKRPEKSPRGLEKYKVRQEVTLDESVDEHSDSSMPSDSLSDDSQIKQSKYVTHVADGSGSGLGVKKYGDIQILEANTIAPKRGKKQTKKNHFGKRSPSKVEPKNQLKSPPRKGQNELTQILTHIHIEHDSQDQGDSGISMKQNDSILDAGMSQDSATTFSNEKLQNISKRQTTKNQDFHNGVVSLNMQNFDYEGALGLARRSSIDEEMWSTDIKIKNRNPWASTYQQLQGKRHTSMATGPAGSMQANSFASKDPPLHSSQAKAKGKRQKLAKHRKQDVTDTLVSGLRGLERGVQGGHLELMKQNHKIEKLMPRVSADNSALGSKLDKTAFTSKTEAEDVNQETLRTGSRYLQVTVTNDRVLNLGSMEMAEKDELSSPDDLAYSNDFLQGAVLPKSQSSARGLSRGKPRKAKPISTRDFLLAEQSKEQLRKDQAHMYAVAKSKKLAPPRHRNSDIQEIFNEFSKREFKTQSSRPSRLRPLNQQHHTSMDRAPKAAQLLTSSALSPLNQISGGQLKTSRLPGDFGQRQNQTRSHMNSMADDSAGNIDAPKSFSETSQLLKQPIFRVARHGKVVNLPEPRMSFDTSQLSKQTVNELSPLGHEAMAQTTMKFMSPQNTARFVMSDRSEMKAFPFTHRQNFQSQNTVQTAGHIQDDRVQQQMQIAHNQVQRTMQNFNKRFPAMPKKKMPSTSHANRQNQITNALKGKGLITNQKGVKSSLYQVGNAPKIEVDILKTQQEFYRNAAQSNYFRTKQTSQNATTDNANEEDFYDGDDAGSDADHLEKPDLMVMASTFCAKQMGSRFGNLPAPNQVLSSDKSSMMTGKNLSCASPTSVRQQILKKENSKGNPTQFSDKGKQIQAQRTFEAYKLLGIQDYFQQPAEGGEKGKFKGHEGFLKVIQQAPSQLESSHEDRHLALGQAPLLPFRDTPQSEDSGAFGPGVAQQVRQQDGTTNQDASKDHLRISKSAQKQQTLGGHEALDTGSRVAEYVKILTAGDSPQPEDATQNEGMQNLQRKTNVRRAFPDRKASTSFAPQAASQGQYTNFVNVSGHKQKQTGGNTASAATNRASARGTKKLNDDLMENGELFGSDSVDGELVARLKQVSQQKAKIVNRANQ